MKCKLCNSEMIIDEWNGWVWTCFLCDHTKIATKLEIKKYENDMNKLYTKTLKQIQKARRINYKN